jgi:hypothetical protein
MMRWMVYLLIAVNVLPGVGLHLLIFTPATTA